MLNLCLPYRLFNAIRCNRCSEIHLPYDGDFRSRISAAVAHKYPRLDIRDFPSGVTVNHCITCRELGAGNCVLGRCHITILSEADGGCPDDGLPIAVIKLL